MHIQLVKHYLILTSQVCVRHMHMDLYYLYKFSNSMSTMKIEASFKNKRPKRQQPPTRQPSSSGSSLHCQSHSRLALIRVCIHIYVNTDIQTHICSLPIKISTSRLKYFSLYQFTHINHAQKGYVDSSFYGMSNKLNRNMILSIIRIQFCLYEDQKPFSLVKFLVHIHQFFSYM